MKFTLVRDAILDEATLGVLSVDYVAEIASPAWMTLEDKDRRLEEITGAKVFGKTAIPRGTYRVILAHSSRFNRVLPKLIDVPGFEGILIHSGNTIEDTQGCILVGETRDLEGAKIFRSREALSRLMEVIGQAVSRGEAIEIEVR